MGAIIVAGVRTQVFDENRVPVEVFSWADNAPGRLHVPEFRPGDGYNKKRRHAIDLAVWHWTGGENEPDVMAETLRKRKLGVEFAISRHGIIWQFCDPAYVDTADSGEVNHRSVGIEIVSYGYSSWDVKRRVFAVPKRGADRMTYDATTHGKTVKTAMFYPAQLRAARGLSIALSDALQIPMRVPRSDVTGVLPELATFSGHIGHYHITEGKRDPGPMLIDELRDTFSNEALRRMRARP